MSRLVPALTDAELRKIIEVLDDLEQQGPGPQERKLRNWIRFRLTGRWPPAVVHERLHADDDARRRLGLRRRTG